MYERMFGNLADALGWLDLAKQKNLVSLDLEQASHQGSPFCVACACTRKVDADLNGTRDAWLPGDKTAPLQRLHHLVDSWRRDEEVPLDVRLGRRPTEAKDVLRDESKVLELTPGGLLLGVVML
jgi:hypothetical protein